MSTYGVYSEDLTHCITGENLDIESAKKWLGKGLVLCSEKKVRTGFRVGLHFHPWRKPHHHKWEQDYELGFMSINWDSTWFTWADKVVMRYEDLKKEDGNR